MSKQKFLKSTVGLTMSHHAYDQPKLVRVEFYEDGDNIALKAVNGHTLGQLKKSGVARISRKEFSERPRDQYNDTVEAIWAMGMLGWK